MQQGQWGGGARQWRGAGRSPVAWVAGFPLVILLSMGFGCGGDDSTRIVDDDAQDASQLLPVLPAEPKPDPDPEPAGPTGPPDSIYRREHLVEVEVEIAPEDWEALSVEGIGMGEILFPASGVPLVPEWSHFSATVTVDGEKYENVDIRKKGYIGSLSVIRPSIKLDFEQRLSEPLVAGNRRMTLNNDLQDPSHIRQCLSYDLFQKVGLPASRCNYAHVVVNGVDLGIYSHVEPVNKPMLRRYFDDVDGNMYEGQISDFNAATAQYLEMETNAETNDRSDVRAVIDALALPDEEVVPALGALVNLDQFIDFWALETLLGHWDGYAGNSNNYFAYHDPQSGQFHFIPWGTDQTFVGDNPNDNLPYEISVYAAGSISNRLYAIPEQRARFRERLAQLNDTLWDVPTLLADVEALQRLAPDGSREAVTRLKSYIRAHGEELRAALALPAPDWPVPPPAAPADPCQGTFGAVSGTFSTEWGSLADIAGQLATGSADTAVDLELDGAPFAGAFRSLAGEDGFLGNASVRLVAPREDGLVMLVELGMPVELFEVGRHPLHSFESFGLVGLWSPATNFINLGLLGDGAVQLDAASLEPGGVVRGSFTAKASYFLCASTVSAFVQAPPPEAPPPADGAEPGAETGEPVPAGGDAAGEPAPAGDDAAGEPVPAGDEPEADAEAAP
jgi:hypothetical protein